MRYSVARENEATQQEIKEASQKRALLLAHSVKSKQEVKLLEEYARRVLQRRECFRYIL